MRMLFLAAAILALPAGLTACAPQPQTASTQYCDQYARSNGVPLSTGGPASIRSPEMLYLPDRGPVYIRGIFDSDVQAHLNQEDALRDYCMRNIVQP